MDKQIIEPTSEMSADFPVPFSFQQIHVLKIISLQSIYRSMWQDHLQACK